MTTKAVFLDALGTLVELEPPWMHLAASSGSSRRPVVAAVRAEMAYYREHAHEATDEPSARRAARGAAPSCSRASSGGRSTVETMMASIRFRAYRRRRAGARARCASAG